MKRSWDGINITVIDVVKKDLCTGCGTCVGICPTNNLEMFYNPKNGIEYPVDSGKCISCNKCITVCPGQKVDYMQLNDRFINGTKNDVLIGNYINCYQGRSTNSYINNRSTSGGLITSLLIYCLETGFCDGVIVTKIGDNGIHAKSIIAKTKEEVMKCVGSKYSPVSVNTLIKNILSNEEKYIFVGLPCHIHGIRKTELINEDLRKKIVLHIGLFCSHTVNMLGTLNSLKRMNVDPINCQRIIYRSKNWPGYFSVTTDSGEMTMPHSPFFNQFKYYYVPRRCLLCVDATSEIADLSFGDAWLPKKIVEEKGESLVISRTTIGDNLIREVAMAGHLKLFFSDKNAIIKSQNHQLLFKKRNIIPRISLFKLINQETPSCNFDYIQPNMIDYPLAIYAIVTSYISTLSFFRRFLPYIPLRVLHILKMLYNKIITVGYVYTDNNHHVD